MVIGFARLGGNAGGIVRNQPAFLAGHVGHHGVSQGARFCALLRLLQHSADYVLKIGRDFCRNQRRSTRNYSTWREAAVSQLPKPTVPKITVITRKAYGGAIA